MPNGIPQTGLWLQPSVQEWFWIHVCIAFLASSGTYVLIWSTQYVSLCSCQSTPLTPMSISHYYHILVLAPFAANLPDALPDAATADRVDSIAIALGTICVQDTDFLVRLSMINEAFIYLLMTQNLPRETTRPGMFVPVGPSGFTVAVIVHLRHTAIPKISAKTHFGIGNANSFYTWQDGITVIGIAEREQPWSRRESPRRYW
ncbi:hypothetical protein MBM_04941 [Drepanopeziza brunnea f. sp. 'multigermtubi' MB_m1]|uniref:Uncharacterized protein n=1 Tax=Marssonina brunnea f. sp. multigermtubi (strain MB_m1) TaxID=1072389 RepID=K1WVG7_MARBU|nr:uncharacterized protein MBM_04941 [Drepanopeziza brunnea f. sp. 'multigermtubi' MB_m1]EKD16472.1 hypothetical protein MBM_04941 [Drepanopeziza brunnea f. sp. 'multigermtubi' MB_m1]